MPAILKFPVKGTFFLFVLSILVSCPAIAVNYYVATTGSDAGTGSLEQPFATIIRAVGIVVPGDSILVRGGTYQSTITIVIDKNGSADNYCSLMSMQGEKVILDFSGQSLSGSNRGMVLKADYWHIEGISITGAGDNGLKIDGGIRNRIVNCAFYRNRDSGVQMGGGASYNQVINCDSYYNADPPDYGDADGFAAKLDVGSENYFYGCRAWLNCDDGWDGYLRGADNVSTIIENSWAFENGYLENGSDPGPKANGNGFKMGGSDTKDLSHDYTLTNCLAFNNKAKGFDQNSNVGTMILLNCTGHNNHGGNYVITKDLAAGKKLEIKNSAVLGPVGSIADFAVQEKNSWTESFTVTEQDFVSIDDQSAYGPRQEDGSLPDIPYMYLSETSVLVDAGVDLGLPYNGAAPDIGCFERGHLSGLNSWQDPVLSLKIFPNPASGFTHLIPGKDYSGPLVVQIVDMYGRQVESFDFENIEQEQELFLDLSGIQQGIYVLQVYRARRMDSFLLQID